MGFAQVFCQLHSLLQRCRVVVHVGNVSIIFSWGRIWVEGIVMPKLPISSCEIPLYNILNWVPFLFQSLCFCIFLKVIAILLIAKREVSRSDLLSFLNSSILCHIFSIPNHWLERFWNMLSESLRRQYWAWILPWHLSQFSSLPLEIFFGHPLI